MGKTLSEDYFRYEKSSYTTKRCFLVVPSINSLASICISIGDSGGTINEQMWTILQYPKLLKR